MKPFFRVFAYVVLSLTLIILVALSGIGVYALTHKPQPIAVTAIQPTPSAPQPKPTAITQPPVAPAAAASVPTAEAVYEWREFSTDTVATAPGKPKVFDFDSNGDPLRVTINSGVPVTAGFINTDVYDSWDNRTALSLRCLSEDLVQSDIQCIPPIGRQTLVLIDNRPPFALGFISGLLTRSPRLMSEATNPNNITVTWYEWRCIENCPR